DVYKRQDVGYHASALCVCPLYDLLIFRRGMWGSLESNVWSYNSKLFEIGHFRKRKGAYNYSYDS
ncbi:MAG: hypothetical protein N3D14_04655, partial [Aquificaceae bacterium]|nr:hypothetical protein [Aquificaceae bacterium]